MEFDKDLQSIQQVRNLMAKAVVAQKTFARFSQEAVDKVVAEIAAACAENSVMLAKICSEVR